MGRIYETDEFKARHEKGVMNGKSGVEDRQASDLMLVSVNILPPCIWKNADIYIICFEVLKANNSSRYWSRLIVTVPSPVLHCCNVFIRVNARR